MIIAVLKFKKYTFDDWKNNWINIIRYEYNNINIIR